MRGAGQAGGRLDATKTVCSRSGAGAERRAPIGSDARSHLHLSRSPHQRRRDPKLKHHSPKSCNEPTRRVDFVSIRVKFASDTRNYSKQYGNIKPYGRPLVPQLALTFGRVFPTKHQKKISSLQLFFTRFYMRGKGVIQHASNVLPPLASSLPRRVQQRRVRQQEALGQRWVLGRHQRLDQPCWERNRHPTQSLL